MNNFYDRLAYAVLKSLLYEYKDYLTRPRAIHKERVEMYEKQMQSEWMEELTGIDGQRLVRLAFAYLPEKAKKRRRALDEDLY